MRKYASAIIFVSLFQSLNALGTHSRHSGRPGTRQELEREDVNKVIEKLQAVVCKPENLKKYLKDIALEDESAATETLDESLRELYKFDTEELSDADFAKMMDAAISGTKKIQEIFRARWEEIRSKLKTDPSEWMKAVDPALEEHIKAVFDKYSENIKRLEAQKKDRKADPFTGIPCAACSVGYQKLSKGLKDNGLARDSKREKKNCPKN